jgi:SWI/SNF-related matrix-associated actin-dependent regulator 1 of chromatin subfamily A
VTIISYDLAAKRAAELRAVGYDFVICDESHALKSHDSRRASELLPVIAAARRVVLLSGTPLPSR